MANDKASTSDPKKKSKSTSRPSGLLTDHAVLVAKVRDDLILLLKAGYFVSWQEEEIKQEARGILGHQTKIMKINIVAPEGVDLSVIDGKLAISGKVLE